MASPLVHEMKPAELVQEYLRLAGRFTSVQHAERALEVAEALELLRPAQMSQGGVNIRQNDLVRRVNQARRYLAARTWMQSGAGCQGVSPSEDFRG